MVNRPQDELLSAYLDGELTAEERAHVEQQLADSAELRQLLDELRSLRSGLELLPRYKLEADFAERVLRKAERSMLSEPPIGGEANVPVMPAAERPAGRRPATGSWNIGGARRWGWAAAAIAAGVLIMIFD